MAIAFIIIFVVFIILYLLNLYHSRAVLKCFSQGNTIVSGMRGQGKDALFCWVINKRRKNYISNVQYSSPRRKFQRFDFDIKVWELSGNTYETIMNDQVKPYVYPYPDGIDYYISDSGVYFPCQYNNELNKRYKATSLFAALSRHLGDCNIHCNVQRQSRLWDKLREQSDLYLVQKRCIIPKVLNPLRLGLMTTYIYSNQQAAEEQVPLPHFGIGSKARDRKLNYFANHGTIKRHTFLFRLPYNYDSRRFKRILENNCKDYEAYD